MPKLFSAKQIVKTLQKARFTLISQRGSHIKLSAVRNGKQYTTIVPNHKTVAKGTFKSILRQTGMSRKEFESYLT